MTETLEAVAKAPTAYEEAKYIWGDTPGNDALGKQEALYEMVVALAQELSDEREIVRGQAEVIQRLRDKVGRHGGILIGMAANEIAGSDQTIRTEPTIRIRINHAHTLKEGWRLSETTVEWTGPGTPDEAAIQDALLTAQHLGQREAALRNAPPVVEGTVDDDVAF